MLKIEIVPALSDNYNFLLTATGSDAVGIVDPSEAAPIVAALERRNLRLTHILNTHHHRDHIGGNEELRARYGATIVGPKSETARIPGMDVLLGDGDFYEFGGRRAEILFVPGHTTGHIAYWFKDDDALFCGDTLFSLGCGRLFEGTPAEMWKSLTRLRALPPETRVYCAHEYTMSNGKFALTVEPENDALRARMEDVVRLRAAGLSTIPTTIGLERATNPFLRADAPELQTAAGRLGEDPVAVFAAIRQAKDSFRA
jgi:hydroxyacylglutathione hydrolase